MGTIIINGQKITREQAAVIFGALITEKLTILAKAQPHLPGTINRSKSTDIKRMHTIDNLLDLMYEGSEKSYRLQR